MGKYKLSKEVVLEEIESHDGKVGIISGDNQEDLNFLVKELKQRGKNFYETERYGNNGDYYVDLSRMKLI